MRNARRLKRNRKSAVVLAAALFFFGAQSDARADDDPWFGKDKAAHFGVTTLLAGTAYSLSTLYYQGVPSRAAVGVSFAIAVGAGKEIWDATGHGDASAKDFAWDVVGAATGVGIAIVIDLGVRAIRGQRR